MIKNLIVCAHWDDEVIGCYSLLNQDTVVLIICNHHERDINSIKTVKSKLRCEFKCLNFDPFTINIHRRDFFNKLITDEINKIKPENIFTHNPKDLHIDHRLISEAVQVTTRPDRTEFRMLAYFMIDTEFKPDLFNYYNNIKFKQELLNDYKVLNNNYINRIITRDKYFGSLIQKEQAEGFKIQYKKGL